MSTTPDYIEEQVAELRRVESWRRYAEARERRIAQYDAERDAIAYEKRKVMGG